MNEQTKIEDAVSPSLSTAGLGVAEDDLDNLRHMLGAQDHIRRRDWGYRNHFAAGSGQLAEMERLVEMGLVDRGTKRGDLTFYHATKAGCAAIGLRKAAIKRAFEQ